MIRISATDFTKFFGKTQRGFYFGPTSCNYVLLQNLFHMTTKNEKKICTLGKCSFVAKLFSKELHDIIIANKEIVQTLLTLNLDVYISRNKHSKLMQYEKKKEKERSDFNTSV